MTGWVGNWLCAFGLTLTAEVLVAVPLLRRSEEGLGRRLAAVLVANLATHPLVWFLFPGLATGYLIRLGLSEAFAVGVETGVYALAFRQVGRRRAFVVSLLANGASVAVGLVLRALRLVP